MLFHSSKKPTELSIIHLNKLQDKRQEQLKDALKNSQKDDKKCGLFGKLYKKAKDKAKDKKDKADDKNKGDNKSVFVLDFDGDIKASAVAHLREEISVIISSAKSGDEVVVRLESGGGQVNAYGLASAQLARLKQAGLILTVCVDKISASGGYMMACVADKIIASDFAVIGSVGVVSQLPNFNKLLKKHDVDFEQFTAGEYKRTVTMFGENDDEDRAKHQADIDRIHELFKTFVKTHRPSLDVEKIATGEIWFGQDALDLGLVDAIGTSDAYVLELMKEHDVFVLHTRTKPTLAEKLGLSEQMGVKMGDMVGQMVSSVGEQLAKYQRP
ncbi:MULTISPECIES: protease SohB [Moraxella]|uniref:Protease SohB n=1 Tax=Moraxella lacunata TaxID=477 RepID=A0A1B8PZ97_MORLA|nr:MULTISPECIES: protease SohB [Moraxella]MBE9578284.1 protease SohB [Moraxella sp. K1664]MBE9587370.1 protease SohB [Moraxella sp. K1630]MBE9590313.1 protease SohB [Moraxella sp. K127]MBE9595890.1 protease SohB [Moraxella sp. K2450]MDH9219449.1 protease SohB [Moraxella lacunata]